MAPMTRRVAIFIQGVVQGVGFRPFVYKLALEHRLSGWVRNAADGVRIEAQGEPEPMARFLEGLRSRLPAQASIDRMDVAELAAATESGFRIISSDPSAHPRPAIPADLATCPECLAELRDPKQRRYRYPFTNCTLCGPRYSIVEGLPYDRPKTSMKGFPLCPDCAKEYGDPLDRRFHAQPIACPRCGPRLSLLDRTGAVLASGDEALRHAGKAVLDGKVLALKGLGGFQLLADATNTRAIVQLRERKHRVAKPFAILFPTLEALLDDCHASEAEVKALRSAQAPILLLERCEGGHVVSEVAPGNPRLGAFLPYTPLHHLLAGEIRRPVVCTSGNLTDEPMCIENEEALSRLGAIADLFLVHDRPIVRPVDDSVAKMGARGLELLRRARGFAPLPLALPRRAPAILALGGELKNTVALAVGDQVVVSQHLGDLESAEGAELLERTVEDLLRFFEVKPEVIACDLHPDYRSTALGERLSARWKIPLERVQHHHAHAMACAAEHGIEEDFLALTWDGTGCGLDGTVWGGEALVCRGERFERFAHLRPFQLPGGDLAAREPRRSAVGLLYQFDRRLAHTMAARWFTAPQARALLGMLENGLAGPTTSMGRLFDAVSALSGLREKATFEGEAAMALEFAAARFDSAESYPLPLTGDEPASIDWEPMVRQILADLEHGIPSARIGARFHASLAKAIVAIAQAAGLRTVALCGGCFQNERLLRQAHKELAAAGFTAISPIKLPPNDGAISLGQVLAVARRGWAAGSHEGIAAAPPSL